MPIYAPLVGEWVKVCQNSGRVTIGILELTEFASSYLRPSIVNEGLASEEITG
ncbi:hypothetical protein HYT56_04295 [Candidatus Woesearchaeota archaeon]|nr:hypothetical protein [Candidatus Woesearchaeota archaeon]